MLIGVTGRGGAGKSTLAKNFVKRNPTFSYIEVDLLVETIVFKSERLLDKANMVMNTDIYTIEDIIKSYFKTDLQSRVLHQCFLEEVERTINETIINLNSGNTIIDWFLLHKLHLFGKCDYKILVIEDRDKRIKRIQTRENQSIQTFLKVDEYYTDCNKDTVDLVTNSRISIESLEKKILKKVSTDLET